MNYPSNSVQSAESSPPPGQRKGTFGAAETLEAACAHVRGVYIERLDSVYDSQFLPACVELFIPIVGMEPPEAFRERFGAWATQVFQLLQLSFFPEEFAEDHEVAERYAEVKRGKMAGLVPRPTTGLLNHCGTDRLLASAKALGAKIAGGRTRAAKAEQPTLC